MAEDGNFKFTMTTKKWDELSDEEKEIEQWKMRKTIKKLAAARGNGTSMISLIVPGGDQIARVSKMLSEEYGTASNIKSRVNRLSVLGAITSAQQRLKRYTRVPKNGLVVYTGTVITPQGKEKKVSLDFEPFKPVNSSLYLCDSCFHTEPLNALLESDTSFGFIIMDGNGCLYGKLTGNSRQILHKIAVDLPKKHGRGGQSALRFARLRLEKRHNYLRKVAELATKQFITDDVPNVSGLVLAGLAQFKTDLMRSDLFDQRLQRVVITIVDVSYGGEAGFNQAIDLAGAALSNVRFVAEQKLISQFFEEINRDTGKYCFGVRDIMFALDQGAVETLLVYEDLTISRVVVKDPVTEETDTLYITVEDRNNPDIFLSKENGEKLIILEDDELVEWLAEHYRDFGTKLELITDKSEEGSQFCQGFGGVGGILRYKIEVYEGDFDGLSDDEDMNFI